VSEGSVPLKEQAQPTVQPIAPTQLDDVFISVKTTASYHKARLAVILKTWFQLAANQVSLITVIEQIIVLY